MYYICHNCTSHDLAYFSLNFSLPVRVELGFHSIFPVSFYCQSSLLGEVLMVMVLLLSVTCLFLSLPFSFNIPTLQMLKPLSDNLMEENIKQTVANSIKAGLTEQASQHAKLKTNWQSNLPHAVECCLYVMNLVSQFIISLHRFWSESPNFTSCCHKDLKKEETDRRFL